MLSFCKDLEGIKESIEILAVSVVVGGSRDRNSLG
jgi:hypothetical protein